MHLRVFVVSFLLLTASVIPAHAATLRTQPQTSSVSVGSTVTVAVVVSSTDQALNAVSGMLEFPKDMLSVISVSKGGSVIGLWVQEPSFSNTGGTVNFEGVVLNPGYQGSSGTIINVTFRALKAGSAALSIGSASVLANDGNGTEILTGKSGNVLSITPAAPKIVPEEPVTPPPTETKSSETAKPPRAEVQPIPVPVATPEPTVTPSPVISPVISVPDSGIERLWNAANYLTLALGAIGIVGAMALFLSFLVRTLAHPATHSRVDAAHELHDARHAMTRALKQLKKIRRERLLSSEEMLVMQSLESSLKVLTGADQHGDD